MNGPIGVGVLGATSWIYRDGLGPAFDAVEISDRSPNDNPTRAISTLTRRYPHRPGVLLRRYDTAPWLRHRTEPRALQPESHVDRECCFGTVRRSSVDTRY